MGIPLEALPQEALEEKGSAFHEEIHKELGEIQPPGLLKPEDFERRRKTKKSPPPKTHPVTYELLNTDIVSPEQFLVEYTLREDAEVIVRIINSRRQDIRIFAIPPGKEGGKKGLNRLILWDGHDMEEREAPHGDYEAMLAVRYIDGTVEPMEMHLHK